VYHVELRQFPHNFCRFNLTERELHATILNAWAREEWIDFGERRWNPNQATLTVLDGPRIPLEQLSMGRGWRIAQRHGKDVTSELLAAARVLQSAPSDAHAGVATSSAGGAAEGEAATEHDIAVPPTAGVERDVKLAADSLGLEVLAKLGDEPAPLAIAWRLARARYPESPASDCLKLAEHAVRSLVTAGLVVVLVARDSGGRDPYARGEQVEQALRAIDNWSGGGELASAKIARA
jgi:hypothetical protein